MSLGTVYMDESGYTGQDLVNRQQPAFAMGSHNFSDSDTLHILQIFLGVQASELHFTKLKRKTSGRRRIIEFLCQDIVNCKRVTISIFDKHYMITGKMVDIIMEPLMKRDGLDLYERGGNIATANLLHTTLPVFCGETKFLRLLASFVNMIRKRDSLSIDKFYKELSGIYERIKKKQGEEYCTVLAPFLTSQPLIAHLIRGLSTSELDPLIPCFTVMCDLWGRILNQEFDVFLDNAKPLANNKPIFEKFANKKIQEREVGYDCRKIIFPLKVRKISFGDSKACRQLQLADLLASASAYWFRGRLDSQYKDEFSEQLGDVIQRKELVQWGIVRSNEVDPDKLGTSSTGGTNLVDFTASLLSE